MKYSVIVFTSLLLFACNSKKPEKTGLEGKPLPDFSILLPDSTHTLNTADIPSGQPMVVFLFGPQCPYSRAQMREIVNNIEQLKNIRFFVITAQPFQQMKAFQKHFELGKYTNITTGMDVKDFYGAYIGAVGVPFIAIYNKDKTLRHAYLGEIQSNEIEKVAFQ